MRHAAKQPGRRETNLPDLQNGGSPIVTALITAGVPPAIALAARGPKFARLADRPRVLQATLAGLFQPWCPELLIRGTLDSRLLMLKMPAQNRWVFADLNGRALASRHWPAWLALPTSFEDFHSPVSFAIPQPGAERRLQRPRVLLTGLFHPEVFPLPRFSLAISDLARAARTTLIGDVELADMQLGVSLKSVTEHTESHGIDILGISATFGQHDLLLELLDEVGRMASPPLVVAGGSLTVRNQSLLLDRYSHLLIARGAGERTIADLLEYWHGEYGLSHVSGLTYKAKRHESPTEVLSISRTATVANRRAPDYLPELDLLDETFRQNGVAQLEASRGCTSACSFCPRGHKGQWAGSGALQFDWILPELDKVFRRYPETSRTIYLVDEEFIGRDGNAVNRAIAIGEALSASQFQWETSCRIDQVVRETEPVDWHVQRAEMWRNLRDNGLRRCLFGVESGVDSILRRFNKETTASQNLLAVRTLTALGIPIRLTYITFDPLMTLEELEATYTFLGRQDVLLRGVNNESATTLVSGIRNAAFVNEHSSNRPFYSAVSYMLVSMECLIGAAYTKRAEAAGLTGAARPSMGRVDARYADWRIGVASHRAQLWVDRNFALDYTLKSLEKVLDGPSRHAIREARVVLKSAAYSLLGGMIEDIGAAPSAELPRVRETLDEGIRSRSNRLLDELQQSLAVVFDGVRPLLTPAAAQLLDSEAERWLARGSRWELINEAESCAT
jgi:hypothetical protein